MGLWVKIRDTGGNLTPRAMEKEVIRFLCTRWLTLFDAVALRCVSRGWRETLNENDDPLWDALIDQTHGPEASIILRQKLAPTRGWQLVRLILREDDTDDIIASTLQPGDIVCMVEMFWHQNTAGDGCRKKRRKMWLGSMMLDDVCGNVGDRHYQRSKKNMPNFSITVPNPFHEASGNPSDEDLWDHFWVNLEVRLSLFRTDTRQSFSFRLENTGGVFGGRTDSFELGYQECVVRGSDYYIRIYNYFCWDLDEGGLRKPMATVHLSDFVFQFQRGEVDEEEVFGEEHVGSMPELMTAIDMFPWKQ